MKDLLETIVKNLVDNVNAISINEIQEEDTTILELTVANEDVGKVIGKQGKIAKAIRT
ncbi:MAG: KH domain-containing protein, partial [Eubacteriales bacterium]|nr:KH domain-containing protein [Eubacteriales bacterium]